MKVKDGEIFYDIKTEKEVFFVAYPPEKFTEKFIICHDGGEASLYEREYLLNPKQYRDFKISQLLK